MGERSVLVAGANVSELEIYCEFFAIDSHVERDTIRLQDMDNGDTYTVRIPQKYVNSYIPQKEYNIVLQRVKRTED